MRRCWLLTGLLFVCIAMAQTQTPQVTFDRSAGGLLSSLRHPDANAPRIVGMMIYTDWGILRAGNYEPVGSQNEKTPTASERTEVKIRIVEAKGQLKDKDGKPCELSYRVEHRIEQSALVLEIALEAERDFSSMHGFLATMLTFTDTTEWFAETKNGWLFRDMDTDGRVFQSSQTPLPERNGVIGIANAKTGWALQITLESCEPDDSLDNVFIHANRNGTGGIFFAWCDGIAKRQMSKGETWRLKVRLGFFPIDALMQE